MGRVVAAHSCAETLALVLTGRPYKQSVFARIQMDPFVSIFLNDLVSIPNVRGWYYTNQHPEETQALYDNSFRALDTYRRDCVELEDDMLLGMGTYGKVYRYGDQAVKVVQFVQGEVTKYEPEAAVSELYILSILAEHPNISCIHAFALDGSSMQLFTELAITDLGALLHEGKDALYTSKWRRIYVDGDTSDVDCRFDTPTLHRYIDDIVTGVHYIHSCGVIHRDLKPSNILVKHDGALAICDMGTAVLSDRYVCYSPVGTAQYNDVMVLASAYERVYTKKCDWWSVGCIIAEMATGMPPVLPILPIQDVHTSVQQMEWPMHGNKRPNEYQPLIDQIDDVVYKIDPFMAIEDTEVREKVLSCFRLV